MWKMCWVGRGEEKSRGALSRSSCFSLVFGTGRRPIIEQTPAEIKFCSPIAKENGWFLASHENLTAMFRSQPTNKKRNRMKCLQWTVILASWKVLLEGSLYVWCCNITSIILWMSHFWKVKSFKHIYTFSFLTLSVQKLQNFPIIPFWICLALRGRRDGLYQSFAKLLLSLSWDIPASTLKHTLSNCGPKYWC